MTRELLLASVGAVVGLTLALFGFRFHRNLTELRRQLQLDSNLSKNKVTLGETVDGEVRVRNASGIVAHVDEIRVTQDPKLRVTFHGPEKELILPSDEANFSFRVTPLTRGRFQITAFTLTLTDTRGLFTAQLTYDEGMWLESHPGLAQPLTPLSLYAGGSNVLHKIPLGLDYAGIREYSPGDEDHKVEWKATARLRRLMVKALERISHKGSTRNWV